MSYEPYPPVCEACGKKAAGSEDQLRASGWVCGMDGWLCPECNSSPQAPAGALTLATQLIAQAVSTRATDYVEAVYPGWHTRATDFLKYPHAAPSAVEAQAVAWMLTLDDCAHPGIAWTEDMARYLETKGYKLTPLYAAPPPSRPVEAQAVNPDEVICPNCVHQFRAIPVNVQKELATLRAAPSTRDEIIEECARVCDQVGKDWQKLGPTPIIETACQECAADVRSLKRGATKGGGE